MFHILCSQFVLFEKMLAIESITMEKREKDKLHIVMLGHKRIPSREGGIEIVVEELATRMVSQGHKVVCYNRKGHHVSGKEYDYANLKEYKGVELKTVLTIDKKGLAAMTSSFFGAVKAAWSRCDVVHFHAEGPCAVLWIPKLFGKRCIATIHGLDHQRAKWGKFARMYIMLGERCAARYADEIIVLSKSVQQYFRDTYGRETVFIPNGVNRPERVDADIIKAKWNLEKDNYVLYLGRVVPEKGIQYLIQAFKNISTDKKLVIAGGASDTNDFLSELQSDSVDDERIIFTGFVQGRELEALYSNAYVYVLPSDLEGMPLSLLEAMSYGNCCLVSDIDECAEVVENRAVIFKKGNVSDLTEKLQMLCEKVEVVQEYRTPVTDFICEKYSWNEIVFKTLSLYEKA